MGLFDFTAEDHVASDDLDDILEYSLQDHQKNAASASKPSPNSYPTHNGQTDRIVARISSLDADIAAFEAEIRELQRKRNSCKEEKEDLERQLRQSRTRSDPKGKGKSQLRVNYMEDEFEWEQGLKKRMKDVFKISEFRLCQKGACNANMDRRDIVCIMPTGGGKSLTYQLPALLSPGCSLVISPLISLMTDQILHLRENNIEAVMINSSTSKEEKKDILMRLHRLADTRAPAHDREIKLCYVTPEKLSKDASFKSLLQKLDAVRMFARIIIDEAHCVSQLGHDFRPDYQKLRELRQLYPRVPIMALSATCGPKVLRDLIKTLGLRPPVDGTDADSDGTVYFSSPLYRKNLHYNVVSKPEKGADHLELMKEYILTHHPNDTGIIYCFTVKDTEHVATKLQEISGGRIRTGVYNASVPDAQKQDLHRQWRNGNVKVVCATIAFGLGIDKGDVRFVLHHSMSKSLEGFYQESGRAGRDGKDSDCILYYRPQDFSSIGAVTSSEKEGEDRLYAMLNFAEDVVECRKIQFAKYFSHSSQLSMSSWTTDETDALQRCGHCDNCKRDPEAVELKDVTLETWQILKIAEQVHRTGGKLTLNQLTDLTRGLKGGSYDANQGKRKTTKEKLTLDVSDIAGGAVDMSKSDVEHLIVRLLTHKYLREEYHQTAYSRIIYLQPGYTAKRLTDLSRDQVEAGVAPKIEFAFVKAASKGKRKAIDQGKSTANKKAKKVTSNDKGKGKEGNFNLDDMYDDDDPLSFDESDGERSPKPQKRPRRSSPLPRRISEDFYFGSEQEESDGEYADGWLRSLRDEPTNSKRGGPIGKVQGIKTTVIVEDDVEVLVLSSD